MESSPVRAFENRRWSEHDQEVVWRHVAALSLVLEQPVIDVGGGDGLFLTLLRQHKRFDRLTLVDISTVGVDKALKKGLDARVVDITQSLPFPDSSAGTVCALDVLEHVYDPVALLREMARVAPSVVVSVPNFHYWKDRAQMLAGRVPFECRPKRGHVYWFNYPILQGITRQAGLQIDCVLFGRIRRLGLVGGWLAQRNPNLFAYSFVARLRRKT